MRLPATKVLMSAAAATVVAILLTGCATPTTPKLPPPAAAVEQLLKLRSQNSTDPAEYSRVVESTALAQALAADSAGRGPEAAQDPTPEWQTPRVTKQETSSAEVRIVWKKSDKFSDWPASTVFMLARSAGGWRVVDAANSTETAK